jgi:drug/metabolite transporter (DMT)-like permease
MTASPNRLGAAALAIGGYAVLIGLTDNFVRVIAAEGGLWQFHATRSLMALPLFALGVVVLGLVIRPRDWRAVALRSGIHAAAMLIYFGCLAFLTVAQVAAGLFTAPIFVLVFARLFFGHRIGPFRVVAALVGFVGVVLVLGPTAVQGFGWASVLPVAAGALYALGNLATREWCAQESAATLTLGFFVALGIAGLLGMGLLALWPLPVAPGPDGFITRGPVWPSGTFLALTLLQAVGSAVAVGLMVRGYQLAEASRVAVLEYVILPVSAAWGWIIWSETLSWGAILGMALIALAGALIALRNPAG